MSNTEHKFSDCIYVITRGKRKNEQCGRRTLHYKQYCKNHIPIMESTEIKESSGITETIGTTGCQFVLTRGSKIGQKCNKKIKDKIYCYYHSKNYIYNKCNFILEKGKRTGQSCDRRCKKENTKCTMHIHLENINEQEIKKCVFIIIKGPRKGNHCNIIIKNHKDNEDIYCHNHNRSNK
jgi:hypothetical protein